MKNVKKQLPKFKSEEEEREFWSKHDSTDYLDWKNAEVVTLKPDKNSNLFRLLIQQARKQAKATKLKKRDIKSVITKVRSKKKPK
jgi:hypothetical protein